ncbi:sigma-54 dependent transcriptional regulator [Chitinasiproducens palmae]|uniref:DNA-binding transcriptional response regulator, NtrC family, contains REC, AAA-type ATPase, and a Fis-type DNA-binding domains n=1 Tax=Chitinasiproducens palmae TaxID=1770053 RepID=A0A1H2PUM7_9BURK|nr:sigma-54 dependent transcriptional regulator [Chitinasiproducens palmae]SDV50541.1 DNA-binding transcriptional response regulator, NtrC family, contains REC, AAA-type ATPase, and a Fis-type DNA-binding domains [Chitinasiproducens palmae]
MEAVSTMCLYLSQAPDAALLSLLKARFGKVEAVASVAAAAKVLKTQRPAVALLDLGSEALASEQRTLEDCLLHTHVGWVALLDDERLREPAVRRLINQYCLDYLIAPRSHEQILGSLTQAQRMVEIAADPPLPADDTMVGNSDAMQRLFRTISKVASTSAPVFISGESGTGKELTALAIHRRSARRDGPFVAINCGAIPQSLMQSELFGYERGAFTGANQRRIGKVAAAHKGTLFLDEIGDLPMDSQASLLRFLQEGQIDPLGSAEPVSVDVRVISATHVDTDRAIAANRFRSDLYHRLCVLRIDEPPLRARGADIELLANHMLERFRSESSRRLRGFSSGAIEALYNYDWPGNVRELINRVRRAVVMAEGRVITAEDLELTGWTTEKPLTLAEAREQAEQLAVQRALRRHRNRLNEAAQELGVSRVTLYRLMGAQRARQLPEGEEAFVEPPPIAANISNR